MLFHAQSNDTTSLMTFNIVNRTLWAYFKMGKYRVSIANDAELRFGCWFKMQATRINRYVKLTLVKLSTGGYATNDGYLMPDVTSNKNSVWKSDDKLPTVLIGGNKSNNFFDGCVGDVLLNNQLLRVWQVG